eukprot:TRINITY_DN40248_c0_g1_i1.p1 TRINITY_DN40248_c0_g1~~TRINITY_DN40248_c0_g1_i1.p1  ORF type:complete len:811 (-),score=121.92 TRINITY_DN40248_c0_g1_i1:268-2700(-)
MAEDKPLLEDASEASPTSAKNRSLPWLRLFVLYVASVFAAGLIPGQALIIPMLAEAGVFASRCEHGHRIGDDPCDAQMLYLMNVFSGLSSISFFFFLPIGYLFDDYGGRTVGTLGAFLTTCGYLVVVASVLGAHMGLDETTAWLVFPAAVLTDFGSMMNSYSLYAMLFHMEGHSTFVISLSNSSVMAAAFLPRIIQYCMEALDVTLSWSILGIAVAASVSTWVCWQWTPDKQEFHVAAQRVLKMPMPKVHGNRNTCQKLADALRSFSVDTSLHITLCAFTALGSAFMYFYQSMSSPYGKALFGEDAEDTLSSISVLATGITGLTLGPFSGILADQFGVAWLAAASWICVAVPTALCRSETWTYQIVAVWFSATYGNLWLNLLQKHVLHYVPANRLGVAQGASIVVAMFFIIPPMLICSFFVGEDQDHGPERIGLPLSCVGGAASVIGLIVVPLYWWKGVPDSPVLLEQDKKDIAKAFGCTTLEQVSRVVGLPVGAVLKRMSRPQDSMALRDLFERIDGAKVSAVLLSDPAPPLDDPRDDAYDAVAYMQSRFNSLPPEQLKHLADQGITVGTADDLAGACACAAASFNGAPGIAPEAMNDWMLGPRFKGDFDGKERLEWFQKNMSFIVTVGSRFGGMLVAKSNNGGSSSVDAVCVIFPPGRLVENCQPFLMGGSRYISALRQSGTPPYFDKSFGEGVRQRALGGALDMGNLHKKHAAMPHWYVNVMAVNPKKQGRKLAKSLLNAVSALADQDGAACYLETIGERNVAVYSKAGYACVEEYHAEVDDSEYEPEYGRSPPITMSLMLRPVKTK